MTFGLVNALNSYLFDIALCGVCDDASLVKKLIDPLFDHKTLVNNAFELPNEHHSGNEIFFWILRNLEYNALYNSDWC